MAVSIACYCTREDVKAALDSKETARNNAQIDREIQAAVGMINALTHRSFVPFSGTRYLDWPNYQYARAWRLWLDSNEVISVSSFVSGGTTIAAADYFLRRSDGLEEPPYTHIEIDLSSSAALSVGSTHQRSAAITGVFGHSANSESAGTLSAAITTTTATTVAVSDSAVIGVGDLVKVDDERMIVTGKTMADTGVNIDAGDSLTNLASDVSITMSTTTAAPVEGEIILIDSERMLVVDVASTVLTVKRAWDGTVLATHAGGADIFALRTLTVVRGAQGTTAATHLISAAVTRHVVPPLVRQLAIAEAQNALLQEGSGYAREVGSGEGTREMSGKGLADLREQVRTAYGRKARVAAI